MAGSNKGIEIDPLTGAPIIHSHHSTSNKATTPDTNPDTTPIHSTDKDKNDFVAPEIKSLVVEKLDEKPGPSVEAKTPNPSLTNEKKQLLAEINTILMNEGQGYESNIGMTSRYWDLVKRFRSLNTK